MTALTIPETIANKITLLEKMLENHKTLIQLEEDGATFTEEILQAYTGSKRNTLQSNFFAAPREKALKEIFITCSKILLEMIEGHMKFVDSVSLKKKLVARLEKTKKKIKDL